MVPRTPTGTETRNTQRQWTTASAPPSSRPMNVPAIAATWLMPIAKPRRSGGKASVMMAVELANSIEPPTACSRRKPMSHMAPRWPENGSTDSRIEPTVKTTKPRL